jgi:hypothetical protein
MLKGRLYVSFQFPMIPLSFDLRVNLGHLCQYGARCLPVKRSQISGVATSQLLLLDIARFEHNSDGAGYLCDLYYSVAGTTRKALARTDHLGEELHPTEKV